MKVLKEKIRTCFDFDILHFHLAIHDPSLPLQKLHLKKSVTFTSLDFGTRNCSELV